MVLLRGSSDVQNVGWKHFPADSAAAQLLSHVQLCDSMDCSLPGSSVHGIFQARILERVAMPSSRDLPDPGIEPSSPTSPALQGDSLPSEPPRKPQKIVGNHQRYFNMQMT